MSKRAYTLPDEGRQQGGGASNALFGQLIAYVFSHYGRLLFVGVFVLPIVLAILYWGLFTSDRYISETRFIVRSVSKPATENAAAFLQDVGITQTNDNAFIIDDYIESRDLMHALMRRIDLREVYRRPEADFITRYWHNGGDSDTDEAFYRYFLHQLTLTRDVERGITTVKVSAYRPADAKAIADAIVELSEARVNELNERALEDTVSLAKKSMKEAGDNLIAANITLTRYRNQAEIVDPVKTAGETQRRAGALDLELAMLRVQLQAMTKYASSNPSLPALKRRIAAVETQVDAQKSQLTGGEGALASKMGDFEELIVKREVAEKVFENAQKELNSAVQDAARQQIYIETIARPGLPDGSEEPRRVRYIITTALLSFWSFLILYLLVSGGREHLNLH